MEQTKNEEDSQYGKIEVVGTFGGKPVYVIKEQPKETTVQDE